MTDTPQANIFEFTVESAKSFDDAVAAIEKTAAEKGFRVLHTHDVAATLNEKGFPRPPLKIIEVCNAKYASEVLNRDPKIAVMLPCPIAVYVEGGKTMITTMLPSAIAEFYPGRGIEPIAEVVEEAILKIIHEAK
jgi:uncharacterized protein (DUF302 family)